MRRVTAFTVATALAATVLTGCDLSTGPQCTDEECVQGDDGEWEIDLDGHRRKKPPAVAPVKPAAPKPAPRRK